MHLSPLLVFSPHWGWDVSDSAAKESDRLVIQSWDASIVGEYCRRRIPIMLVVLVVKFAIFPLGGNLYIEKAWHFELLGFQLINSSLKVVVSSQEVCGHCFLTGINCKRLTGRNVLRRQIMGTSLLVSLLQSILRKELMYASLLIFQLW